MLDFDDHLEDLVDYAHDLDIKVSFIKNKKFLWLGRYLHTNRSITIDQTLERDDEELFLFVLAHEIGHAIDWDHMKPSDAMVFAEELAIANSMVCLNYRIPRTVIARYLVREQAANNNAKKILRELGVPFAPGVLRRLDVESVVAHRINLENSGF